MGQETTNVYSAITNVHLRTIIDVIKESYRVLLHNVDTGLRFHCRPDYNCTVF